MSMEFFNDTLDNLLEELIDYRGKTPTKVTSGIPLVTAKIIKDGVINEFNEFIAESDYDQWMVRGFPKQGDVVLTTEAPLGEVAQLDERKIALAQRVVCLRGKSGVLNNTYLKYYFLTNYGKKKLKSRESGTTVTGIKQSELRKVEVRYPSFENQCKIASILSTLDDKIAINRRICENLESQAQALFKHWFIDFAPFKDGKFVESELGMIPEGWRVGRLEELGEIELGGTPSRANKSYWGGNIAWINSGEVNKFRICQASEYITEEGLNRSATKLLPAKTTVLAITGATLGQVSLLEIDSCANQSVVGIKENKQIPYTFIFPLIKSKIKELMQMQTGGAQQHINKDNIQSLKIVLCPEHILSKYNSITQELYGQIGNLCFENIRLSSLRETLLPKLMSGQIKL